MQNVENGKPPTATWLVPQGQAEEPRPGDVVEIISATHKSAPVGSRWLVNAVFDGALRRGRYVDLVGCLISPLVRRVRVVAPPPPKEPAE